VWSPLHILPGYAIGAAATDPDLPGQDQMLFFGGLLILVAVLTWLLPWLVDVSEPWRKRHAPFNSGWRRAVDHAPENQWLAVMIGAAGLIAFALTALTLPLWSGLDQQAGKLLYSLRQPALDHVFIAFSLLGERPALMAIATVVTVWLSLRREWHTLKYVALTAVVCLFVPAGFKELFATPRPQFLASVPESYAFPSGHAMTSVVAWGFLYAVVARQMQRDIRPWLLAAVLTVVVFTCASRLYLGVHWLSDVAGGLTLGCCMLAMLRWGWYRGPGLRVSHWESSAVVLGAVGLSLYLIVLPAWPYAAINYAPREVPGVVFKKPLHAKPAGKPRHHKLILP
jgi:undecaprenyl-diphosphatase